GEGAVAVLEEVRARWPPGRAEGLEGGVERSDVLTSRNSLVPLRRAIAVRWPDKVKSNGGGASAILVRGSSVTEHRALRLCWWPERRWLHAVRVATGGWVGSLHATVGDDPGARRDAEPAR